MKGTMKAKTLLLVIVSVVLLSAASERTYMGYQVVDKEFPIAGGKTVSLPVTQAGPVPAENRDFKIEVAWVSVQPALFNSRQAALAWGFSLTSKASRALERVVVEEVYPSAVASIVVDDRSPSLKEKVWFGSSVSVDATSASVPWLFSEKDSVFVFRITITPAGSPPVVLYQPAWISLPAKQQFQRRVMQIHGS